MRKEIFPCYEKSTLLQINTFFLLFLFSQHLWARSTKATFDFPKFTCSSGLTQGRAGGSDPWGLCRNRAHHGGWAEMVPPSRYRVPEVTGEHTELVHRPSHSHLMWSNKQQLPERGGPYLQDMWGKGRALYFLRIEDTWVCFTAGEKVPFERQTCAHKRDNWLEQDFCGGGRVPRVQRRFGFRLSRGYVSNSLGRKAAPAGPARDLVVKSRNSKVEQKFQIQVELGSNPRSPLLNWVNLGSISSSKKIRILYFHPSIILKTVWNNVHRRLA